MLENDLWSNECKFVGIQFIDYACIARICLNISL